MFDRVLRRLRARIEAGDYVVTTHADDEMDDDGLSVFDLESAVLNGTIVERQRDRETQEQKYVVRGEGTDGSAVGVVVKFSVTGRAVVLTVFRW